MSVRNKLMSTLGQCDGMIDPLEQQAVQFFFQLPDLKRNGGLGISKLLGSFRKTSQFRYMDKRDQIA